MSDYRLDLSATPDWAPVERLSVLLRERGEPPLEVENLMYMGRLISPAGHSVLLFKHQRTRAYLCVDEIGHRFRAAWSDDRLTVRCEMTITPVPLLSG